MLRDLPKDHRRKLIMMGYKRLGKWIDWYAKKQGVPLAIVKPNGTSSECPKCSSKLEKNGYRRLRCPRCGFEVDRDVVGKLNIRKRGLRRLKILNLSGGSLTTPSASQMTDVSPNRWGDNEPSERNDDQGEGLKAGEVSGSSDRFG